jgi:hypothetical protein
VLFVCEHRVFGVGMFDVSAVLAGDARVATAGERGSPVNVLVGTVSRCHGAVNILHLGACHDTRMERAGTSGRSILGA